MSICNKTVSKKHIWGYILRMTGNWWTDPIFQVDINKFFRKCIACGIVDDRTFSELIDQVNEKK